jgi:hypothetical protein
MAGVDTLSPIGCHYFHNEEPPEQWEVSVFAARTEIVGGERDGQETSSRFTLDLKRVVRLFSEVKRLHWQGLEFGADDEVGSHISIEGIYLGRPVWLRILAHAPKRFESGRYAHAYQVRLEDLW